MKRLLFAALALVGLATACDKDADEVQRPYPASLDSFTKRHSPPIQVFEFDPTQQQTIRTLGGARFEIKPNVITLLNGTAPSGTVKLQFQEIYSPADMVLANIPTMGPDKSPLVSGGEFMVRLTASATGEQLMFTGFVRLIWPTPTRVDPVSAGTMLQWQLWGDAGSDSTTWLPSTDGNGSTIPVQAVLDSVTSSVHQYIITNWPDTLGWLNCDAYWATTAPRVQVNVALEDDLTGTRIFLIPTNLNGAFRPSWNAQLQRAEQSNIPVGAELTAVVFRIRDGKYYIGTHRAAASADFMYRPVLEEVTEEELVRRIRLL
jgi:hypothetical protein